MFRMDIIAVPSDLTVDGDDFAGCVYFLSYVEYWFILRTLNLTANLEVFEMGVVPKLCSRQQALLRTIRCIPVDWSGEFGRS